MYVDDIKLAGKTEKIEPTWEILIDDVDLGELTSFLDHVYLGCTQRECQISKDIVTNYRDMFETRISAGAKEKLPARASGKPDAETSSSWSYDMEGHAKTCVEGYCELEKIKRLNTYTKSQHHAWMTFSLRKKKMDQLENCPQFAHKTFLTCQDWHVLGDLNSHGLWINLLERSQNGQKFVTNAWRVWYHTFIIQVNTGNVVMWETQHNSADLGCFRILILPEIWKTQHQPREGSTFGSHTFVPRSWMCKKHTSVSHSSIEAESISLDAGLRMDGIPALTQFLTEQNRRTQERAIGKPVGSCQAKHA